MPAARQESVRTAKEQSHELKRPLILIVDDGPMSRAQITETLEGFGYEVRPCAGAQEGLDSLDSETDLVVVDADLAGGWGIEIVRRIRCGSVCPDVPLIMVTAVTGMPGHLDAVQAGVNDFICRPIDPTELQVRVVALLKLKQAQDSVKLRHSELEEKIARQTAALEAETARLELIAKTDALTGLANHGSIVNTLLAVAKDCLTTGSTASVLFLDLDHFKTLNDTYGHISGDSVLREFGQILEGAVRGTGYCGRWGGEEFVVILPGTSLQDGHAVAEDLRKSVSQQSFDGAPHAMITCSIGVASIPADGKDLVTVVEAADRAMYVAKSLGRNQVRTTADADSGLLLLNEGRDSQEDLALKGVIDALVTMVGTRDVYDVDHTGAVESLALRIAAQMRLSDRETHVVAVAAKLHDIGKVAIPDAILQKAGPLNDQEWETVRSHPVIGAQIIERMPALSFVAPVVKSLHERWDGKGYPLGLKGAQIPLPSRIVAVADAFSAMTADRPHKLGITVCAAVDEIRACSGTQFAPEVVEAFLRALDGDQDAIAA